MPSCSQEAKEAAAREVDYIAVGAIYSTESKSGTRPAGLETLKRVRELLDVMYHKEVADNSPTSQGVQRDSVPLPGSLRGVPSNLTTPQGSEGGKNTVAIPIVAIGGISLDNVGPVLQAGANGICVIGAVCQADDPEEAARRLVERITAFKALGSGLSGC